MLIAPSPVFASGEYRSGTLIGLDPADVEARLGFAANREDDPGKVSHSWGFLVDGVFCAVWTYRGGPTLSTFGPAAALRSVFGNYYA
jgi:hypothetical protein